MKTIHNMNLNESKRFDKKAMGYDRDDIVNPKDMEKYYSKDEQDKYGVIGIEIKVIEDRK